MVPTTLRLIIRTQRSRCDVYPQKSKQNICIIIGNVTDASLSYVIIKMLCV